jgi:hypothetical protein
MCLGGGQLTPPNLFRLRLRRLFLMDTLTDQPGWHTTDDSERRDIPGDHRACANYCVGPDSHTSGNHGVCTDPNAFFDVYFAAGMSLLIYRAVDRIVTMIGCPNYHVLRNQYIIGNFYVATVSRIDTRIHINRNIVPNPKLTIVCMKRAQTLDPEIVTYRNIPPSGYPNPCVQTQS